LAGAAVDHMISLTVFMVAILLFIGMFSQTIQTAIVYESHRALSTKTSDLLDTMMLNPGLPTNWGKSDVAPDCFGLQNPDYPQYKLSTFSLMKLSSTTQSQVYYPRTNSYYSNTSAGLGGYLFVSSDKVLNYSVVSKMLGINGTYGFLLTLTPLLNISISPVPSQPHLTFDVSVNGVSSPLAQASVTYSLFLVNQDTSYTKFSGTTATDEEGLAQMTFPQVNGNAQPYALIVYAHLYGLKGMGYYVSVPESLTKSVVPMVDSFAQKRVLVAHSDSIGEYPPQSYSELSYNASFAILTDEYLLRPVTLNQASSFGKVTVGSGILPDYAAINVPDNDGILIVTYKESVSGQVGIVLMPWGVASMAFPVTLGANPKGQEWVTTDIRQVTIGGLAYEAKLALWNLKGFQGAA
jgi:hypothetical protein